MNQPKDQMSEALCRLDGMAPEGASSAVGDQLRNEFRRHHVQRRKNRYTRISLLAACLIGAIALSVFVLRPRKVANVIVTRPEVVASAIPSEPGPARVAQIVHHQPAIRIQKFRALTDARRDSPAEGDRFVALPTFDPAIPIDHLDMVRLDLPGRALQLVGYPVSEEMAERRILADVLLAQDGTPYALRLVQTSGNEGR